MSQKLAIILALMTLGGCAVSPPRNTENACHLLAEKPGWYDAVSDAADSWDVSEGLILSFIRQESSFVADAKPPRTKSCGCCLALVRALPMATRKPKREHGVTTEVTPIPT